MTLRTVLVWSMAASVFAGCSGGAGSVPTSAQRVDATNSAVSLRLDSSQFGTSSSSRRSPDFIGASVNNVAYSFTPGPIAGTIALSTCPHSGTPAVYTCTIGLPANTYALTVTLENGATPVGSGSATGIAIAPNATTPVSLTISPINAGPTIAVSGSPTQFYIDGHAQTITTAFNELDPAGNIITTYYGPVTNYPTLTLSDLGGTTGVNLGTTTFSTAPSTQAGNSTTIGYNGVGVNATSLGLKFSDGTNTSNTVTIPYISLSVTGGPVAFTTTGAGGNQTVTVSDAVSTGGTPTLDAKFTSSTTCAAADVTFSPTVAVSPNTNTNTATAGSLAYTLTANDSTFAACSFTVTSFNDANLSTTINITPPGGAGIHISSVQHASL